MSLEVIITGITLMKDEWRCISGYAPGTGKYFRPCIKGTHITEGFLANRPRSIEVFSRVVFTTEGDANTPPPHSEDVYVSTGQILVKEPVAEPDSIPFLHSIADEGLVSIYGDYIEHFDNHFVVPTDCGHRSLGTIIARKCKCYLDPAGKTRIDLQDKTGFEVRNIPCVARDLQFRPTGTFTDVPVRMSLSRAWRRKENEDEYYWLQCSGVFV
ncbi:MAG: hypothetical protein HBSAPP04_00190 [Ignavibacteriaceae bacterium]|nr:MAG: hypothetical protein HBSAPP04_00190 [Ignavibacteriaceae bacterium]